MDNKFYLFLSFTLFIIMIYLSSGSLTGDNAENIMMNGVSHFKASEDISNVMMNRQCDNCKGRGIIECPECKGSGESMVSMECQNCGGTGEIYSNYNFNDCPFCHDGQIVERSVCSTCHGLGYVKCLVCGGTGVFNP
ncbi:MAG: hypothetical protein ACXVHV_08760 [Methanobacterium sp.]